MSKPQRPIAAFVRQISTGQRGWCHLVAVVLVCLVAAEVRAQSATPAVPITPTGVAGARLDAPAGGLQPATQPATPGVPPVGAPQPSAEVDATQRDFGEVWAGTLLSHTFTIRNTGAAPLKITSVRPACGCTLAGKYPQEIAAGQSGGLPFQLSTTRFKKGRFSKSITVQTSDPNNAQIVLALAGTVKHYVEIDPPMAQFGRVQSDSVMTRTLTITNQMDKALELSINPSKSSPTFKGDLTTIVPGQKYELTVTASPPYSPRVNRFPLELSTNIPEQSKIEVMCMATFPARLELQPDSVRVLSDQSRETVRRVRLTNNAETPVQVLSVETDDPALAVSFQAQQEGKLYDISVTLPNGYQPPAGGATVLIRTDDSTMSEVRLPILSVARAAPGERNEKPVLGMIGKEVSAFEAITFDERPIAVGPEVQHVQLLVFYASWCAFSRQALPDLEGLHREYADKGVDIIALNLDDRQGRMARTEQQSIEHYKNADLTLPMLLEKGRSLVNELKVTHYPTVLVLGRNTEVEAVHVGHSAGLRAALASEIDVLLQGKGRSDFPSPPAESEAMSSPARTAPGGGPAALDRPEEAPAASLDEAAPAEGK